MSAGGGAALARFVADGRVRLADMSTDQRLSIKQIVGQQEPMSGLCENWNGNARVVTGLLSISFFRSARLGHSIRKRSV